MHVYAMARKAEERLPLIVIEHETNTNQTVEDLLDSRR
jgi:hypothetical protein